MGDKFILKADYQPAGDQPEAITGLLNGLKDGLAYQTLLGVTGKLLYRAMPVIFSVLRQYLFSVNQLKLSE